MDVSPRRDMFSVAWSPRCTVDICLQILPSLAVILSIYFHRNFAEYKSRLSTINASFGISYRIQTANAVNTTQKPILQDYFLFDIYIAAMRNLLKSDPRLCFM